MTNNNLLIKFLQELLQRVFTKSPKFFRIFQLISGIGAAVTGLPEALAYFGITLPPALSIFENKFIAAVSTGMFIMSSLTTQSTPIATDRSGQVVMQTDEKKLPFTAANEATVNDKKPVGDIAVIILDKDNASNKG